MKNEKADQFPALINTKTALKTTGNGVKLKYSRRKKRTIGGKTFEIQAPLARVSEAMQKVPNSDTTIEQLMATALSEAGIMYAKSEQLVEKVEGKPDFVLPRFKIAVFCDGDYWHGRNYDPNRAKNNKAFWNAKIERNIERDLEVTKALRENGWKVLRFWEYEILTDVKNCVAKIQKEISNLLNEIPLFTFVDLFAGIGGFRISLEQLGGKCLGFAEIDKAAIETYKVNFIGDNCSDEIELGSVSNLKKLPFNNIDLIVGGVPCQSWSVAGKMRGFQDPRGQLWLDTIRIIELNRPKAFIFENVKGLYDPRNKASLNFLLNEFGKLGYEVRYDLLNSYDFGLPQNRERIFLVGIKVGVGKAGSFKFPDPVTKKLRLGDLISGVSSVEAVPKTKFAPSELFGSKVPMSRNRFQKLDELNDFFVFCDTRNGHTTVHSWEIVRTSSREKEICMTILKNRRKKKYGPMDGNPISFEDLAELIPKLKKNELERLVDKRILRVVENKGYEFVNSKNSSGINGIYRVYLPHSDIFSTLTATGTRDMVALKTIAADNATEYKERFLKEIVRKKAFRPITAKEAGKLQGFPSNFAINPNEKIAHRQFGNAVSTSVVFHLAKNIIKAINLDETTEKISAIG